MIRGGLDALRLLQLEDEDIVRESFMFALKAAFLDIGGHGPPRPCQWNANARAQALYEPEPAGRTGRANGRALHLDPNDFHLRNLELVGFG